MPESQLNCASKGAIVNLTRFDALELAPTVRVNCICPGVIDTDMVRIGGFADLSKEAGVLPFEADWNSNGSCQGDPVYLASPDAGFITGSALAMDGGATAGH